jgi:glyoxylase-like metal-dependent hydrolase (beta-lactamase superfamily II)
MSGDGAAWYEPGVQEVAAGVYRIPLPLMDELRAVNVYAIVDGDSVVMVDAGWVTDESRETLASALRTLGFDLSDIAEFLITHVHADHYSQAVALRAEFGSPVSLGEDERPTMDFLARPLAERGLFGPLRLLQSCGAPQLVERLRPVFAERADSAGEWTPPDRWLRDGNIDVAGRRLRAIATPGHTQGHLVFLDAGARLLFAGDHLLPHITPSIAFEGVPGLRALQNYMFSLQLMRAMPDCTMLPAHGPARPQMHDRIDELLDHHRARLAHARQAVAGGATTAHEVAQRLRWTRHERELSELNSFNQMLAVLESAAHLDVLVERGDLASALVDGTTVYSS